MKKTGIIIQARKGSTRLPNKMVIPFYQGMGVLQIILEKVKRYYPNELIVLATTNNSRDDELEDIANTLNIKSYRGDETNVLSRFIEIGDKYNLINLVRICGDNPFLDVKHISELINEIDNGKYDYVSYKTHDGLPVIKSHLGLFTEVVSLHSLKKIPLLTNEKKYFEHVTNYIYENNSNIKLLNLPKYFEQTDNIRLTLDTLEDFLLYKEIFEQYKDKSLKRLIESINLRKDILDKMKSQIKQNLK